MSRRKPTKRQAERWARRLAVELNGDVDAMRALAEILHVLGRLRRARERRTA